MTNAVFVAGAHCVLVSSFILLGGTIVPMSLPGLPLAESSAAAAMGERSG